ncbi:MAG: AAA family ATPase [Bacilli bacterium]|nr:AAA family ATPase [Bacilli bacterium]
MSKKYVATIMDRISLGSENFIFVPNHPAVGEYDKESHVFSDNNGLEYFRITDGFSLQSEISHGFANLEEMQGLLKKFDKDKMSDAIAEYFYQSCRFIYYVSHTMDGGIFCYPIDVVKIKDDLNQALEDLDKEYEKAKAKAAKKEEPFPKAKRVDINKNPIFSEDINPTIASFLMDLMDGVYSLDDLKEIKKRIEKQRNDYDNLLDSLDLQIESSEYGESQILLRGEDEHTKRKVRDESDPTIIKLTDYVDIVDLYQNITKTLIAQNEPLKRVLTEIIRKERSEQNNDRGILITGATGSGKTKMMELIAKYLNRPFIKIDSTQLTIPGYVGKDIEEELWRLYIQCGRDVQKAERAIVFFDEIDKKGSSNKDDVSGKGVLNVLLTFLDGTTYDACESMKYQREIVPINTRKMLVILGGAFEDVYRELHVKNNIGFSSSSIPSPKTREATVEDFVEYAKMPREFMGRVAIIKLNDLDYEAIKKILTESDESALKVQQELFRELGVKLTPGDDYIDAIAHQAIQRKTGARGLNNVVDESTWQAYGDAYTHLGEYQEIILGKETVEDPSHYQKVKKKKK